MIGTYLVHSLMVQVEVEVGAWLMHSLMVQVGAWLMHLFMVHVDYSLLQVVWCRLIGTSLQQYISQ
jgi:hypothetical protein